MTRRAPFFLFFFLTVGYGVCAQLTPSWAQTKQAPPTPVNESRKDTIANRKADAILRVQTLVSRVSNFRDTDLRLHTLIGLADVLWTSDPAGGRQLFMKVLETLRAADSSSASSAASSEESKREHKMLMVNRRRLIESIASHDPAWAKRLIEEQAALNKDPFEKSATQDNLLSAAFASLKDSPTEAAKFAQQGVESGITSEGFAQDLFYFIIELRKTDVAAANQLYLEALASLEAQPSVKAEDLMIMGTYVLQTTVKESPLGVPENGAIVYTSVGKLGVVNITTPRSDTPPEILRAYLDTCIRLLSRPIADPQEKQVYYVLGYQLMGVAQQLFPDRATQLSAAMQAMSSEIPAYLTQESTYANLKRSHWYRDTDESLDEIEKIPDLKRREARYLGLVLGLWTQGKFDRAREVAAKIKDSLARSQLVEVINFGEAKRGLESGNLALTVRLAGEIHPDIQRAILWLGLAHAYAAGGDKIKAGQAIAAALQDTENVEDRRRPYLILTAAGELARFDPSIFAVQRLLEAITAFNTEQGESLTNVLWFQHVEAGVFWRDFPLPVKGIQFTFRAAFSALAAFDPDATLSAALGLKSEEVLSEAAIELAAVLLK
jgi:hypothetical protein